MSIATAKWILEGASKSDSVRYYYRYGTNYPHPLGGYGSGFQKWLWQAENGDFEPYVSCGNGCAMRVGPVGWAFDTIEDILVYANVRQSVLTIIQKELKVHRLRHFACLWVGKG